MEPRRLPQGAVQDEQGQVKIPATTRPDGSVRKEIKIRQGYVPQEEQPLYRPRHRRNEQTKQDLSEQLADLSIDKSNPTMNEMKRTIPLGAVQTEAGEVVIPTSTRPDGSVRKEIRVRQGFVPQDEQPVYRPRALREAKAAPSSKPSNDHERRTPTENNSRQSTQVDEMEDKAPPAHRSKPNKKNHNPQNARAQQAPVEAPQAKPRSSNTLRVVEL